MNNPEVSIIVVIGNKRERAKICFDRILAQENIDKAEIIVVDANTISAPKIPIEKEEVVYLMQDRMAIGDLKYLAIKAAKGYWISFIEEHVRVHPDWLNSILRTDKKYAGMSGEIFNANQNEKLSNILHYCNYYRWIPPTAKREATILVGHNASYAREIVLRFGDRIPILIQNEILLLNEMVADGCKFIIDPANKVSHINESSFLEISYSYFYWHACLGGSILFDKKPGVVKRISMALINLIKPISRTAKILIFLIQHQPKNIFNFIMYSPVIFYAYTCACLGISWGLLFPSPKHGLMLTKMEVDANRTKIVDL